MRSAYDRSDFQAKVHNTVRMSRAMAGAGSPTVPHAPGVSATIIAHRCSPAVHRRMGSAADAKGYGGKVRCALRWICGYVSVSASPGTLTWSSAEECWASGAVLARPRARSAQLYVRSPGEPGAERATAHPPYLRAEARLWLQGLRDCGVDPGAVPVLQRAGGGGQRIAPPPAILQRIPFSTSR
jgi:hypothetical protein